MAQRGQAMNILHQENELNEIVQLVGIDALSADDRLTMEVARMLREDFLQQNAFTDTDAYTSFDKQYKLLHVILNYDALGRRAVAAGVALDDILGVEAATRIGRAKHALPEEYAAVYNQIESDMKAQIDALIAKGGSDR